MEKTEIFAHKPQDLKEPLVVAGGLLMHDDKFLLLKRHPEKPYGHLWNLPAGKVDLFENPQEGAQREIHEETGIFIPLESLKPIHVFYLKRGTIYIQFHVFKTFFLEKPEITLKLDENTEALWTSFTEAFELPLLGGGHEILDYCVNRC
jgi:8-oxo-dGTP pyrophosphatase MutT (NUDIX family)